MTTRVIRRLRETARPALHWACQQLLRGDRYECPCCGYRARRFRSYGAGRRPNEMCPACRSLKRHRWQWLVLRDHLAVENQVGTLLHVAPEGVLAPKLRAPRFIHNIRLDLNSSRPIDVQADLVQLPFNDESVDYVLCSHVLEHVSDDVAAMTEIHRVLRTRGWALIGVPVRLGKPTLEDVNATTPDERQRLFGHPEHVRYYGRDLITRLESAGFDVTLIKAQSMGPVKANRYLCEGAVVFVCRRGDAVPGRKGEGSSTTSVVDGPV